MEMKRGKFEVGDIVVPDIETDLKDFGCFGVVLGFTNGKLVKSTLEGIWGSDTTKNDFETLNDDDELIEVMWFESFERGFHTDTAHVNAYRKVSSDEIDQNTRAVYEVLASAMKTDFDRLAKDCFALETKCL